VAQIYLLIQKKLAGFSSMTSSDKRAENIIASIAGAPVNSRNILSVGEKILKLNIYINGNPAKPERFM